MKKRINAICMMIIMCLVLVMPGNLLAQGEKPMATATSEQVSEETKSEPVEAETDRSGLKASEAGEQADKETSSQQTDTEVAENEASDLESAPPSEDTLSSEIEDDEGIRMMGAPQNNPADETKWSKLQQQIEAAGTDANPETITVDTDITADLTKDAGRTIEIKENQNVILKGSGAVKGIGFASIKILKGGSLTLEGISLSHAQILVEGKLNLNSGKISDTKLEGPTIFVNSGEFTMNGGEVSGIEAIESQAPQPSDLRKTEFSDGYSYYEYSPITVYGGHFNLTGGKISDNHAFLKGGAIGVWGTETTKAKVVISGGELTGNKALHPRRNAWGGSLYVENCEFEMSNGSISKGSAEKGGGIAALNSNLTFVGGHITENTNGDYKGWGGGIYAYNTHVDIKDIDVSQNTANGPGGGIYLSSSTKEQHHLKISGGNFSNNTTQNNSSAGSGGALCVLHYNYQIDGGKFVGNSADRIGGAISFAEESTGVINAGLFKDNAAHGFWGGGAIFNDNKCELVINRALVKENTIKDSFMIGAGSHPASRQGGGIWNCPTGHTEIHITNGLALFDNTAPNLKNSSRHNGAGDDFINITKYESNKPTGTLGRVKLASRMLGGGARLWYQDGSFYGVHTNLDDESKQVPRYNSEDPGQPLPYNTVIEEKMGAQLAYKSVPADESKELAEQVATSIFTGNMALGTGITGGAISNNGKLEFGEDKPYRLKIVKSWSGDDSETRPKEILLEMYIGDHFVEDVKLTAADHWTKVIEDFPDPDTLVDNKTGEILPIHFKEKNKGQYVLSVLGKSKDEKESTYTIDIENKLSETIVVKKVWQDQDNQDGKRPENIRVRLLADGEAVNDKILVLNAENNWSGEFTDLSVYKADRKIAYTVEEIDLDPRYTSIITGSAADGFVITNERKPEPPTTPTCPSEKTCKTKPTPPSSCKPVPKTGENGSFSIKASAILLAAGGILVLIRKRKKKSEV